MAVLSVDRGEASPVPPAPPVPPVPAAPTAAMLAPPHPPGHLALVPPGTALGIAAAALGVGIGRLAYEAGLSRTYVSRLTRGQEPPWLPGIERCWQALTRVAVEGAKDAKRVAEAHRAREAATLLADKAARKGRRARRAR